MKKWILAALAAVAISSSAMAQGYVGGTIGSTLKEESKINLGVVGGYQFTPNFALEGTYDYASFVNSNNASMLMANFVAGYPIPDTIVTPYVLVGVGFGFNGYGTNTQTQGTSAIYNVGAGMKTSVSQNVDLDLRYRYFGQFNYDNGRKNTNMLTVGANYKF